MIIEVKPDLNSYIKLQFYSKKNNLLWGMVWIIGLYALIFCQSSNEMSPFSKILVGIGIASLLPLYIYISATRRFASIRLIKQEMTYEFTSDKIITTGKDINFAVSWNDIYKIIEVYH